MQNDSKVASYWKLEEFRLANSIGVGLESRCLKTHTIVMISEPGWAFLQKRLEQEHQCGSLLLCKVRGALETRCQSE